MTTHVPEGVSAEEVNEVRAREAVHSRELAARVTRSGSGVTRCGPGSGVPRLFAADDRDRLEEVLASMPLRIWRDDEVTPLSPHPNDPPNPPPRQRGAREFLTTFVLSFPEDVAASVAEDAGVRSGSRS